MKFRQSTLVWVAALALLLGVWTSKYVADVSWILYLFSVLGLPIIHRKDLLSLLVLFVCLFCLGLFRAEPWARTLEYTESRLGEQVTVEGRVITDSVYDERRQTEVEIDNVVFIDGGNRTELKGRLRVSGFGAALVLRHDIIRVSGKLNTGFGSRIASMSFSNIEVLMRSSSAIEEFRRNFSAQLYSDLSDQDASLALGILVGQRTAIAEGNEENLRIVGLTHIIAVSGYNLSVLVRLVRRRLGGLSKFQSLVVSVTLVTLFVLTAGASASIVRATWVIGFSLAAWYFGRHIRPLVLLMISAAATVWFDPFYIWFDIGWWLSFAAFFGVLMVGPQLQARIFKTKKPHFLIQIAIESLAASLLTAPIIMWVFDRVSLVSLVSNILVVPVIPIIMVLSFTAGMLALLSRDFLITKVIVLFAGLSLSYVLVLSSWLAGLGFAELEIDLSTTQMILCYVTIVFGTFILHQKTNLKQPYNLLE